jgi:hypothetical protein
MPLMCPDRPVAAAGAAFRAAQARAAGTFAAAHQRYWDAARRKHGDAAGTRALIEVLLAHRTLPAAALAAAMDTAAGSGVLDPQVIVIEARRQARGQAGLARLTRLPAGHWTGERAATDILTLARKGRAFASLDALIARQGGQHVLYGSALALAATLQAWSRHAGTPLIDLARTVIR